VEGARARHRRRGGACHVVRRVTGT
jgi:hypothetical protein